jgi:predicted GIY-YIG superfamily endonuclease
MPYMYILECADGSYYVGSAWNLEGRLWEHQNGLGANHTAKRLPVRLVYCEECERIEDAYRREKQVQGWGRKKKEALIAGDWERVHALAECRNGSHWRNLGVESGAAGADATDSVEADPTDFDSAQPTGSASTE